MAKFRIFKRGEEWSLHDGRRVRILRFSLAAHGERYWWVRALDRPFGVPPRGRPQWCKLMRERDLLRVSRGPEFTKFMDRVLEPGPVLIPLLGENPIDVRAMADMVAAGPLDAEDRRALRNMYFRFDRDMLSIETELDLARRRESGQ